MSLVFLEIKYAKMVGQTIDRWKVKREHPFHGNGRCPICLDSAVSKSKARFHINQYDDGVFCKCYNCDYGSRLSYFLKEYFPALYSDYIFERYRESGSINEPIITTKNVVVDSAIIEPIKSDSRPIFTLKLPYIKDLPQDDPVRVYVDSRGIPDYPFQYAQNFYEFSSQFNSDLLDDQGNLNAKKDESRLVIPFFDRQGNVFAYQGRDLSGKSNQKYITIVVNPKIPKVFGIDRLNIKEPVKIVEGPIDSLFLKNCVASVNASLIATAEKLEGCINKHSIIIVYDNEKRNKNIVKYIGEAINKGYRVVIWPENMKEKDINDLVLAGKDPEKIIAKNTFRGLEAQLQFQRWKKI